MRFLYNAVAALYLVTPDMVCSHLTRWCGAPAEGDRLTDSPINLEH